MKESTLYLKKDSTLDFKKSRNYIKFKDSYSKIVKLIIEKRKKEKISQMDITYEANINRKRVIKFEKIERIDMELLYFLTNKFNIEITFKDIL